MDHELGVVLGQELADLLRVAQIEVGTARCNEFRGFVTQSLDDVPAKEARATGDQDAAIAKEEQGSRERPLRGS
jgi:hypothetical protein